MDNKVEEKPELEEIVQELETSLKNHENLSDANIEILESDLAALDLEISDMGSYENWCDMLEDNDNSDNELNFIFQNQPDLIDDEEEEDNDNEEYQKNLCKEYRKFLQNKINRE